MRDTARTWAGPCLVALTLVAYAAWTWGKWPDVLVDFGRELYVPWQLASGRRLYADVAYFNGPLSATVNGALFWLVGPSLRALVLFNLAIIVAVVTMVHELLRYMAGRFVAAIASLAFLVFFAFAQFMPGGNYNYLAPYSHEATHGVALSLAALVCLGAFLRGGRPRWAFAAGVAAGLALLTKPEFTVALGPALVTGLLLQSRVDGASGRHPGAALAAAAVGYVLPPALAFVGLATQMPATDALRGVAGAWTYVFDPRLRELPFYRDVQGTLDVGESLRITGTWLARYAAVFVPAAIVAAVVARAARWRYVIGGVAAAGAAAVVLVGRTGRDWENLARPFPWLLAAAAALLAVALWRRRAAATLPARGVFGLACLVFALGLLLKTILHASLLHYGFVLAMPAGLAIIALAVGVVPAWLDSRGRAGLVFRAASLGALVGFGVVQVNATNMWLNERTVPIGQGADQYLVHQRDRAYAEVLARLEQLRAPVETLVVIPEGVMLNYLVRAENPTGFVNFLPPELIMFGERRILDAFRSRPPDWIVITNRGATEYGYRFFGADYAQALFAWIEAGYEVVDRVFETDAFGQPQPVAAFLRHRAAGIR